MSTGIMLIASPAHATGATVTVGMPFTGKWAYSINVNPPYTDSNSSHPSVHATYGANWATDLYALNADVVANVSSANGPVTLSIDSVTDTSCNAGKRVRVKVKVGEATLGYVSYEHLDTALTSTSAWPSNNVLGKTKNWGNLSCYVVSSDSGVHAHVSFTNSSGYACYIDNGNPGVTLNQGVALGKLGDTGVTGTRDDCASSPATTPPPSNPNTADFLQHNANGTWSEGISSGSSFGGNVPGLTWGKGDRTLLGDVTGDGKADLVVHNPANSSWDVAVNNGSGEFNGANTGTWLSGWGGGDWATLANISGDAKMELIVHNSNGTWAVASSNGSSFTGGPLNSLTWGLGDWRAFADVTGDGVADYITHNLAYNRYDVSTNSGGTFGGANTGTWLTGWGAGDWVGIANVDGVSGADIVIHTYANGHHYWDFAFSSGHSLSGGAMNFTWGSGDWMGLADVTGDGKADLVIHNAQLNRVDVAMYNSSTGQFNGPNTGTWLTSWGGNDWVGLANIA